MKILTDCSGNCNDCIINYTEGCLDGYGDDNFYPITEDIAKILINEGNISDHEIQYLKNKFPTLSNL